MLKIAVVEDEEKTAQELMGYLKQFGAEQNCDIQSVYFSDGMEIAEGYRPVWDVILLDIEMPLLDGMSAAERIRQIDSSVLLIFITNMAQYAIQSYEVNALDYVLKPVNYFSFRMKLLKAMRILQERPDTSIAITIDRETKLVRASEICYVEARDHRLVFHTDAGVYTTFGTLRETENILGKGFARCGKSFLVNLRYVDGIRNDQVLLGSESLRISRSKRKDFLQALSDYCRYGGR